VVVNGWQANNLVSKDPECLAPLCPTLQEFLYMMDLTRVDADHVFKWPWSRLVTPVISWLINALRERYFMAAAKSIEG